MIRPNTYARGYHVALTVLVPPDTALWRPHRKDETEAVFRAVVDAIKTMRGLGVKVPSVQVGLEEKMAHPWRLNLETGELERGGSSSELLRCCCSRHHGEVLTVQAYLAEHPDGMMRPMSDQPPTEPTPDEPTEPED